MGFSSFLRNLIYNGILLSPKKNEIMPFSATWMLLKMIILREVRQKEKKNITYHLYVEYKIRHKK